MLSDKVMHKRTMVQTVGARLRARCQGARASLHLQGRESGCTTGMPMGMQLVMASRRLVRDSDHILDKVLSPTPAPRVQP